MNLLKISLFYTAQINTVSRMIPSIAMLGFVCDYGVSIGNVHSDEDRAGTCWHIADGESFDVIRIDETTGESASSLDNDLGRRELNSLDPIRITRASAEQDNKSNQISLHEGSVAAKAVSGHLREVA